MTIEQITDGQGRVFFRPIDPADNPQRFADAISDALAGNDLQREFMATLDQIAAEQKQQQVDHEQDDIEHLYRLMEDGLL